MKINRISPLSHPYLKILDDIAKSPEKLYFIGNLPSDRRKTIAIVGSRKPTSYGKEVTYNFAYDLAKRGIVVVSGLALGVDAIAHRAAIDAGGTTIAVLASGLDIVTPHSNQQLADEIIKKGGAIISEYRPGTPALAHQFLERNRLVSGLSDMVLVTEAAKRSGTLSTVAHALEQGKEVGVTPGNITSPLSAGCNMLIRQGAAAITDTNDVLQILQPEIIETQSIMPFGSNKTENDIIKLIHEGLRDGDEIREKLSLSHETFSTALTMLEIEGIIRPLSGNRWTIN